MILLAKNISKEEMEIYNDKTKETITTHYIKTAKTILDIKGRKRVYLYFLNDEHNIIYDTVLMPSNIKNKYKRKIFDNFLSTRYFNLAKDDFFLETKKIANQPDKDVYLIRLIRKNFLKSFYQLERVQGLFSDIELLSQDTYESNTMVINNSYNYLMLYCYNKLGFLKMIKIPKINTVEDIKEINKHIKDLFFEEEFKVEKIILVSKDLEEYEGTLKEETGIEVETQTELLTEKIFFSKKTPNNFYLKKINNNIYSEIAVFCLSLLLIIQGFSYYHNNKIKEKINEVENKKTQLETEYKYLENDKQLILSRIESMISEDRTRDALMAEQFYSNKSYFLYKVKDLMLKDIKIDKIYGNNDKIYITGRSTNYSDIGFFVKKLEFKDEIVENINITGKPDEIKYSLILKNKEREYLLGGYTNENNEK